ncbi:MAG: hypothetical protein ABIO68_06085 [Sphingomicrobium sp.]
MLGRFADDSFHLNTGDWRSVRADRVTEFDFAFLAGLYLSRAELGSKSQRASIIARMTRTLLNPPPPPPREAAN